MYTPTLAQARSLADHGAGRQGSRGILRYAPMYREVLADLETPVSAYLKLGGGKDSFLLESVEGGEHVGRYSFIGLAPRQVLEVREEQAVLESPENTLQLFLKMMLI